MLDHLSIQVADPAASAAFYDRMLAVLGGRRILEFGPVIGYGTAMPTFWVGPLADGERGSGGAAREAHIAFIAPDRGAVDAFHAEAVAAGAEILHPPRVRPEYHPNYYGAFVR